MCVQCVRARACARARACVCVFAGERGCVCVCWHASARVRACVFVYLNFFPFNYNYVPPPPPPPPPPQKKERTCGCGTHAQFNCGTREVNRVTIMLLKETELWTRSSIPSLHWPSPRPGQKLATRYTTIGTQTEDTIHNYSLTSQARTQAQSPKTDDIFYEIY